MVGPLLLAVSLAVPPVVLGQKDSGRTITVRAGTTVVVKLSSNPTTGYAWKLLERPDRAVLRGASHRYAASPAPPGKVGVGGTETWRFVAVAAGRTSLRLGYLRSWEPKQVLRSFRLLLRVP